ncbi:MULTISPECIES: VCBS repeat-containing protein [unclassified Arcicella]|uniref:VCBS repeat-containing protein n=1 Tax=unclassified Arcicella TaxID=2644986 RepID=UPI00285575F5|nr:MULTISPECIES: VCBS repeat-containing protein [unclassified Arcicella]MDR6561104.1 hypothetical protein [Arcicella sp. BE51]MDR6810988.1 hypothetical protein [Arcicella sp. BE140]MDR6822338.1 hypothetical protein [Arcicella sp. BE139]
MNKKKNIYSFTIGCLCLLFFSACKKDKTLFEQVNAEEIGIQFANNVQESEKENILNYEYFYNGGGVAAGDFNNDGLTDLYFTGNQVDNKLYLNTTKDNKLSFEDITSKAGVMGRKGGWKTGVSIVDINADGWLDIYVCYSGLRETSLRKNQLFINNHNLTFTEKAEEYGLADSGYSTQATFLDYDLDGDLDCFLINHNLGGYQRKEAAVMRNARDENAGDKLFRNDTKLGEAPSFTDVSIQTGIKGNPLGFGLGVSVADVNQDGYPDIYVTNDYVEDDYLYINQKDGTFKDELRNRIEHTAYSAMGVDIADVNNDELPDIFTLDMLPEDNARQKLLLWSDSWNTYDAQLRNGFWHENMRNMLQMNLGNGAFAEIGQLAGISNTDWSWGTLLADFDLDGYKDIFVSNGLGKDYTNADFIKYFSEQEENGIKKPMLEHLKQMPTSQTKNYIFKNNHDLTFSNEQKNWGFDTPTVASGAIYADLDNDGDLEIITNNLNETAHIYNNKSIEENTNAKFLKIHLKGDALNTFGIGAKVSIRSGENVQVQEVTATHGFQSSVITDLLFGIAETTKPLEVTIVWSNGKSQKITNPVVNQTLVVEEKNAVTASSPVSTTENVLFTATESTVFFPEINPINNFDRQVMLPTHYSYSGPRMAVGDVNADGKKDVFICGTKIQVGAFFLQNANGSFTKKELPNLAPKFNQDAVIADFNGDKFPDLYITNGNYGNAQYEEQNDELWINDGKGNFQKSISFEDQANSSCVKAADFDKDGDVDLFVGGHIKPNRFPTEEESFLLKNDGKAHFTKVPLGILGLVTDATMIDTDKDGFDEIIVVGEWMSPVLLKNNKNFRFTQTSLGVPSGWNYRIEKADLDNDGDEDLVLGNLGTNTQIRASQAEPAFLIYDDFDQNGTMDFFLNYYIQGQPYPACSRDEMAEQIPALKKKFPNYQVFSEAKMEDFFDANQLAKANKKEIANLKTIVLENNKGTFVAHELPLQAQYAPVYAISIEDIDHDGKKDLLLAGNNSKFRLRIGKVDANYGVVLLNKGNFSFTNLPVTKSGLYLRGDVRETKAVDKFLFVGVNNDKLRVFKL